MNNVFYDECGLVSGTLPFFDFEVLPPSSCSVSAEHLNGRANLFGNSEECQLCL